MKTRQEIIEILNAKMAEEFELDPEVFTPDADIVGTLDLDSLSLVDLIGIVKVSFGVTIDKADLPQIHTMKDLYDYIEQRIQ